MLEAVPKDTLQEAQAEVLEPVDALVSAVVFISEDLYQVELMLQEVVQPMLLDQAVLQEAEVLADVLEFLVEFISEDLYQEEPMLQEVVQLTLQEVDQLTPQDQDQDLLQEVLDYHQPASMYMDQDPVQPMPQDQDLLQDPVQLTPVVQLQAQQVVMLELKLRSHQSISEVVFLAALQPAVMLAEVDQAALQDQDMFLVEDISESISVVALVVLFTLEAEPQDPVKQKPK